MEKICYPFSIKNQIEILNEVKLCLNDKNYHVLGLCAIFGHVIRKRCGVYPLHQDIIKCIPSFTRLNAIALALRYGYKKPCPLASYWWTEGSRKHRLLFVNALITELENLK